MAKKIIEKATLKKIIAEVNEKGNTIGNMIECAQNNGLKISDLGAVDKEGDNHFWQIDGVGKLVELSDENSTLILKD